MYNSNVSSVQLDLHLMGYFCDSLSAAIRTASCLLRESAASVLTWSAELRIEYSISIYIWRCFRFARGSGRSNVTATRALGAANAPSSDIRRIAAALMARDLTTSKDPIPESEHERLWQNAMKKKDIHTISIYSF